jgi:hypothetical protein
LPIAAVPERHRRVDLDIRIGPLDSLDEIALQSPTPSIGGVSSKTALISTPLALNANFRLFSTQRPLATICSPIA